MELFLQVVWTLTPPILILVVLFFVLRKITRADRKERNEYARIEAEERAKRAAAAKAEG